MRIPRIYFPNPLASGVHIELDESGANHVARVLRLKEGAALTLFNGSGGEFDATLLAVERRRVVVEVGTFAARESESPLQITLAQGISRGERMDYTIQKAVELGVTTIVPLVTERCMVELKGEREEKRLGHWRGIIIGACEQSGRNHIPRLEPITSLASWLERPASGTRLLLDHRAGQSVQTLPTGAEFTLLIGPEGGFAPQEREQALRHDYQGIRLGPRVLRTETAALAALTALQTRFGDLG